MLDSMRTLSKSLVSKLLMILLVISFAVWGMEGIVNSGGPSYALKVGNERISISEFQQQRQALSRQLEAVGMTNMPAQQLTMSVVRQLVQQKLSLMAMQDMGLVVNDELLSNIIANLPDFQNKDGKFDAKKFQAVLASQRLSEKAFLAQFKRDVAGRFLTDSLSMHDAVAPSSVVMLETAINNETRDAVLFTIPAHDAMDESNETALKAYYEETKEVHYLRPESRTLDYVVLTADDIDAFVANAITDAMVSEASASNPNLAKPLLRMKLKTERRDELLHGLGNSIEDELAAGKTMGEAFAKAGINTTMRTLADASASLAKTSEDDVTKTVVEQGFGLGEGEISRLISSKKGALLMVSAKKITAAAPKPYDAVKADVKARLGNKLARDAARAKAVSMKDALAKAPNWQAVAEEKKLASRVVSDISRPTESNISGTIPAALRQAIFERSVGEVAGPMTLENGDQLIALVTAAHVQKPSANAPGKEAARISEMLGQNVQNRAYESFSNRHKIDANPAIMRQSAEAK